jgi:hypothetical protein
MKTSGTRRDNSAVVGTAICEYMSCSDLTGSLEETNMNTVTKESEARDRNRRNVEAYFAFQTKMDLDLWYPDRGFNVPYAPEGFP